LGDILTKWQLKPEPIDIKMEVENALTRGNAHWYEHLLAVAEGGRSEEDTDQEVIVNIEVINTITQDLHDGRVLYRQFFQRYCELYFST
jgi:hypothetical protein